MNIWRFLSGAFIQKKKTVVTSRAGDEKPLEGLDRWRMKSLVSDKGLYSVSNEFGIHYLADSNGDLLSDMEWWSINRFSDGLAVVTRRFYDKAADPVREPWRCLYLYGAVNEQGGLVIPCSYSYLSDFSEGIALAKKKWDTTNELQCGFLLTNGTYFIDPVYQDAYPFMDGYAWVKEKGKWGVINTQVEQVKKPLWFDAQPFTRIQSCRYFKVNRFGGWGVADLRGELVVDCVWDNVGVRCVEDHIFLVRKDKLWGLWDLQGRLIVAPRWIRAYPSGGITVHGITTDGCWEKYDMLSEGST